MRNWLRPARRPAPEPVRTVEATPQQIAMTGAAGGGGWDPVDNVAGWRRSGAGRRDVPEYTRQRAVDNSVASYRSNPMATAVVDTYVSFVVGDKGVSYICSNPEVDKVVKEFWDDPKVRLGSARTQVELLRSTILWGELPLELMVGEQSGAVRFSVMDPAVIDHIELDRGNPLWPSKMVLTLEPDAGDQQPKSFTLVQVDDETGLRTGNGMFFAPWKTLVTDTRGVPFLTPVLDQLDAYDTVLSNLIDRTSLARYLVWTVMVKGSQAEVDAYIRGRGGLHIPPSGSVEVHNENVEWKPQSAPSGAQEDTQAAGAVLTQIAGGAGLAKTWLAEPDGANRATSLTMAEPVRRRVGLIQRVWLDLMTEIVRFVVDQAVKAGRLPATVEATDPRTGVTTEVPAAMSVQVTGPEIAAADAQLTAQTLLNIATGLDTLVKAGLLTPEAGALAAQKAWEDYMGIPFNADLNKAGDAIGALKDLALEDGAEVIDLDAARESTGVRDGKELHAYWVRGEGLAKWVDSPTPWTTLHGLLSEYLSGDKLDRTTSAWYIDVFGHPPGAHSKKG